MNSWKLLSIDATFAGHVGARTAGALPGSVEAGEPRPPVARPLRDATAGLLTGSPSLGRAAIASFAGRNRCGGPDQLASRPATTVGRAPTPNDVGERADTKPRPDRG